MGLLSFAGGLIKGVATGVKNVVNNARTGKAAIQAGFTIKGGAQTDQAVAANSVFKSIPVYVWGLAGLFIAFMGFLAFGRRR